MTPIGYVRSPYHEKFAIPRQPGLAPSAIGYCELIGDAGHPDAIRGIEQFSHIWVLFQFHKTKSQGWQPLVRPPRLGGNKKIGVFASRSTFRPNGIGMSLVELLDVKSIIRDGRPVSRLKVRGLDLVDGTPIYDLKPYLPYAESIPQARAGYAAEPPITPLQVEFSPQIEDLLEIELKQLISEVLQQDPRPAYQQGKVSERIYGMALAGQNINFCYPEPGRVRITAVEPLAK